MTVYGGRIDTQATILYVYLDEFRDPEYKV